MRWIAVAAVGAGMALAAGISMSAGAVRWRAGSTRAIAELPAARDDARRATGTGSATSAAGADQPLPPPVARYLAFALPHGPRAARTVTIEWTGEFRMGPQAAWLPFTATQHFTLRPPGFVWDASIRMLPLVPVRVRDAYGNGAASMLGRIGGLLTVVEAGFSFGDSGEITAMRTLRYRDVDGTSVLTPFEGRYGQYELRDGMKVPTDAEVAWLLPEGRFAYWRGRPLALRHGE